MKRRATAASGSSEKHSSVFCPYSFSKTRASPFQWKEEESGESEKQRMNREKEGPNNKTTETTKNGGQKREKFERCL